jgi:hypothetical protein
MGSPRKPVVLSSPEAEFESLLRYTSELLRKEQEERAKELAVKLVDIVRNQKQSSAA